MLRRAAKLYINWLYLVTLLRNAVIVATYALIQAYNQSGGQPNWPLIYMVAGLAFAESIIEHVGNAKFFALLKLIWEALQQLSPSQLQQILVAVQTLQSSQIGAGRETFEHPAQSSDPYH